MELADDVRAVLFEAGATAVRFNAPLGIERAAALVGHLAAAGVRRVVDLGCGRGAFATMVAGGIPAAAVIGVDIDQTSVERARAGIGPLGDRIGFEVGDAATWSSGTDNPDAVVCIGASHAFGGPPAMFARLAEVVPAGIAVVGDGVWSSPPSEWCVEAFGELPASPEALAAEAVAAGWAVVDADTSTLEEWDAFEGAWIGGVRGVGTSEALAFAEARQQEYGQYRGILGFAWLVLRRPARQAIDG